MEDVFTLTSCRVGFDAGTASCRDYLVGSGVINRWNWEVVKNYSANSPLVTIWKQLPKVWHKLNGIECSFLAWPYPSRSINFRSTKATKVLPCRTQ